MPMMPFSGVRMSWLMRERNSDLAALAKSASLLAFWSAAICFCSCSYAPVMSEQTTSTSPPGFSSQLN